MHLYWSHRLMYVHVPQVVMNLIFSYNAMDFLLSQSPFCGPSTRDMGREVDSEH